jgi:Na+/H+ antiporter NhaD/arsenite permease-like protein
LFFLGILLCINALESAGLLSRLAAWMDTTIHNSSLIAIAIGLASAIVDNVPLVAATMGMYSLDQYAVNCPFWNLTAYCAGTGGSILIVGSAAGVAFMGMEKVNFIWYLRKIGPSALFGYLAGAGVYLILAV